jgi:hypothetical protein
MHAALFFLDIACLSVIAAGAEMSAQIHPSRFSSVAVADRTSDAFFGALQEHGASSTAVVSPSASLIATDIFARKDNLHREGHRTRLRSESLHFSKVPVSAPICAVLNGKAHYEECRVVAYPAPFCCKLSDGSLVTEHSALCECRRLGTVLLRGACP